MSLVTIFLEKFRLGKIEFPQISQHQGIDCCIVRNFIWKKINTWARVRLGHGNARPSILGHGARSELSPKKGSTVLRYLGLQFTLSYNSLLHDLALSVSLCH